MSKELVQKFIKFEETNSLFDLKYCGVWVWPVIRFRIYSHIYQVVNGTQVNHPKISGKAVVTSILRNGLISLKRGPFFLKPKDTIIINHKRKVINEDGYYECKYTEYLNTSNAYVLEAPFEEEHLMPSLNTKNVVFLDFILNISRLSAAVASKISPSTKNEDILIFLKELLEKEFDVKIDNFRKQVLLAVYKHKSLGFFWHRILNKIRPKHAFVAVAYSDVNLPFIEEAKKFGTKVCEIQHGIMGDTHIAYNFHTKKSHPWFPDEIWVWNKYWAENSHFPIEDEKIRIKGFPFLNRYKDSFTKDDGKRKMLLFISQGPYSKTILEVAMELNKVIDSEKYYIGFKPHPSEVKSRSDVFCTLEKMGIEILKDSNIYENFKNAYCQFGINSTALFEGLEFGLKTFVIRSEGSEVMEGVQGVIFVDQTTDVLNNLD